LNLREAEALGGTLMMAHEQGLGVLTNRPLNCLCDGELIRLRQLPDGPAPCDAPTLRTALAAIEALEREFRDTLAHLLEATEGGMAPEDLFRFAELLGDSERRALGYEAFEEFETMHVAPRLGNVLRALDAAFGGRLAAEWRAWRARYVQAVDDVLSKQRGLARERSRRCLELIAGAMRPLLPAEGADLGIDQQAIWSVASLPGVSSVLVGMRRVAYVDRALEVLSLPPLAKATELITRTRNLALPAD
jgi:hypothetical protein